MLTTFLNRSRYILDSIYESIFQNLNSHLMQVSFYRLLILRWLWLLRLLQDPPFGTRTSLSPREPASRPSTSAPSPVMWTTSSAPSLSRSTTPPRKTPRSPTPAVPSRSRSRKSQVNKAHWSIYLSRYLCGEKSMNENIS